MQTLTTSSPKQTQKLASDILNNLNDTRIIALYGDLGSGKTTFIQGLAKSLGITKKIISPTFIIMRSYQIPMPHAQRRASLTHFYHLDLYRINNTNELQDLGIFDLLKDPQNLVAIEWPEKIRSYLPENRINIHFEYIEENKRKITF
jgi:tRNA threonylcarbamoyladenosine biosynthesis protein TsaE